MYININTSFIVRKYYYLCCVYVYSLRKKIKIKPQKGRANNFVFIKSIKTNFRIRAINLQFSPSV